MRVFECYAHTSGAGALIVEQAWAEPWMSIFARLGLRSTSAGGVTIYYTGSGPGAQLASGTRAARGAGRAQLVRT
jgi:hypothetical protein